MKMTKRAVSAALALITAAALLTGCSKTLDGTETVCTVNDDVITMGEYSFYARYEQGMMHATYTSMFGAADGLFDTVQDDETGDTVGDKLVQDALDTLIRDTAIAQHAADYGVSLDDEELAEIDRVAQAYIDENDEAARSKVAASKEDVVNVLKLITLSSKMREPMTADMDTEVTDEEAAQTKLSICRIKTNQDETAEEALTNAEKILAALQNEKDPAAADIETIAKGIDENASVTTSTFSTNDPSDSILNDTIMSALDGVDEGEFVDYVIDDADANSYVIIRVDTYFDEDATERKKTSILNTRRGDLYSSIAEGWVADAAVERHEKAIAKIEINDRDAYTLVEDAG